VLLAARTGDGHTIADPFAPTADLVALLGVHAVQPARTHRAQVFLRLRGAGPRKRAARARGWPSRGGAGRRSARSM
jgi:hypothetical protein